MPHDLGTMRQNKFGAKKTVIVGWSAKWGALTLWAHPTLCVTHWGWWPPPKTHSGRSEIANNVPWFCAGKVVNQSVVVWSYLGSCPALRQKVDHWQMQSWTHTASLFWGLSIMMRSILPSCAFQLPPLWRRSQYVKACILNFKQSIQFFLAFHKKCCSITINNLRTWTGRLWGFAPKKETSE